MDKMNRTGLRGPGHAGQQNSREPEAALEYTNPIFEFSCIYLPTTPLDQICTYLPYADRIRPTC